MVSFWPRLLSERKKKGGYRGNRVRYRQGEAGYRVRREQKMGGREEERDRGEERRGEERGGIYYYVFHCSTCFLGIEEGRRGDRRGEGGGEKRDRAEERRAEEKRKREERSRERRDRRSKVEIDMTRYI